MVIGVKSKPNPNKVRKNTGKSLEKVLMAMIDSECSGCGLLQYFLIRRISQSKLLV